MSSKSITWFEILLELAFQHVHLMGASVKSVLKLLGQLKTDFTKWIQFHMILMHKGRVFSLTLLTKCKQLDLLKKMIPRKEVEVQISSTLRTQVGRIYKGNVTQHELPCPAIQRVLLITLTEFQQNIFGGGASSALHEFFCWLHALLVLHSFLKEWIAGASVDPHSGFHLGFSSSLSGLLTWQQPSFMISNTCVPVTPDKMIIQQSELPLMPS